MSKVESLKSIQHGTTNNKPETEEGISEKRRGVRKEKG